MAFTSLEAENANWITSAFAITILIIRLVVSRDTPHSTALAKCLCAVALLVVTARIPVTYYVLKYGTAAGVKNGMNITDPDTINKIKIGTVLTLVTRVLVTTYFWLQISLLLHFYSRVIDHIQWTHRAIRVGWWATILTYIACILATFLECRPFHLYWQIRPAPDHCTNAYVQIFVQGAFNLILDLMLLVISFALLASRQFTNTQYARIAVLLSIGTFCIIVTGLKLAYVVNSRSQQATRSFWASVQVLVSAFVANVPTIYGCVHLKRRRAEELRLRKESSAASHASFGDTASRCRTRNLVDLNKEDLQERGQSGFDKVVVGSEHHEFAS